MEPSGLRSCRSFGDNALKDRKFTADVVEDAVENDPQTTTMCGFDQRVKIGVVAEAVEDAQPVACLGFGARKSKRIDVPPQRVFDPILQSFSFWSRPTAKYLGRQILQQSGIVAKLGRRSHEGNASAIEHVSMAGDL